MATSDAQTNVSNLNLAPINTKVCGTSWSGKSDYQPGMISSNTMMINQSGNLKFLLMMLLMISKLLYLAPLVLVISPARHMAWILIQQAITRTLSLHLVEDSMLMKVTSPYLSATILLQFNTKVHTLEITVAYRILTGESSQLPRSRYLVKCQPWHVLQPSHGKIAPDTRELF